MSPVKILDADACVNALIDEDTRGWNSGLIDRVFMEHEAAVIKSIPIIPGRGEDTLIWSSSPNGKFSVKSAYFIGFNEDLVLNKSRGESSNTTLEDSLWKNLWRLQLAPKIKVFGWKICKNILPVKTNLRRRGLEIEVLCPICHREAETMAHCFNGCKVAKNFWSSEALAVEVYGKDGVELLREALIEGKLHIATSILLGLWILWLNRNSSWAEGRHKEVQDLVESYSPRAVKTRGKWSRPAIGSFKVNFDGSLLKAQRSAGVGVIIRDDQGIVPAALASKEQDLEDLAHVEALAAFKAVSFALEMGFRSFCLEGDSLGLINALNDASEDLSPIGHIVEATKAMLSSIPNLHVGHVKREGNKAVHGLAVSAHSLENFRVWVEDSPTCISSVIAVDRQPSV